jgi:hypothetical protein
MSARRVARTFRLSYVKVVEFQRRGSVHVHALVRVDVRGDEHGKGAPGIDAGTLVAALRIAAKRVSAPLPGREDRRMVWGDQVDAAVVAEVAKGRRRAAAYLAKYATKGSDEDGILDHRLRSGVPRDARIPNHLRMLVETAWRLSDAPELANLHLRGWAHSCGFRGHFLTKSQRYSTTFGALRAERQLWRMERRQEPVANGTDRDVLELREWRYEGTGYLNAGDVCLARNIEDQLQVGRWLRREDESEAWGETGDMDGRAG